MITKEFAEASTEINEILKYLPEDYVYKIPVKLKDFFKKVEDKEYVTNIDQNNSLDEQDIKPKTKTLLTILYREYWCNEEEKAELDKILMENDKKYEAELREKYNPDNIFKNKYVTEISEEEILENTNKLPVEIKESLFKKVINFFKRIFKSKE